jgi:hypothetical protein
MKQRVPSLLLLVSLVLGGNTRQEDGDTLMANHLDELLSLSELPLKRLLHVKRTFADLPPEGRFVSLKHFIS